MRFVVCAVLVLSWFAQAEDMRHKAYRLHTVDVGSNKQFFFDNHIIEDIWGVTRTVHSPVKHPANPILKATQPWEQGPGLGSAQRGFAAN